MRFATQYEVVNNYTEADGSREIGSIGLIYKSDDHDCWLFQPEIDFSYNIVTLSKICNKLKKLNGK